MTPPAATAAGRALPRTVAPRAPRRVSGPAPRAKQGGRTGSQGRRPAAAEPFALRAVRRGRLLADSRLLDRLVRGRLWIPLVAAGLMGIVFMQVSMLKLNSGIGRAVQASQTLERQNTALRADVSRMESGERIDSVAHDVGMVVPADGGEHYVSAAGRGLAARAAQAITAPDATAMARARAATQLAAGQLATGTVGAAALGTAAPTSASAQTPAATATTATAPPVGTTATAPPAATPAQGTTPATAGSGAPAQTAAPAATTQSSGGVSAAPTTASSPQQASPTTAAATAGGAAAPAGTN
ncbi:MAG: hypothetical protein QOF86_3279 [Baekduia sp.]|nr:hypothetical protein [Baekduia sp.]